MTVSSRLIDMFFIFFHSGSAGPMLITINLSFYRYLLKVVSCFLSSSEEWYCQKSGWMVMSHTLFPSTSPTILLLILSPKLVFFDTLAFILSLVRMPVAALLILFLRVFIYPTFPKEYAFSNILWLSAFWVPFPFFCCLISGGVINRSTVIRSFSLK